MFLTAVLQSHTDSQPSLDHDNVTAGREVDEDEDTVSLPAALKEALKVPLQDRLQPLPSVHRSRWV
jgi:hypothetical protein